jgi:hypothetical protein
MYRSKSGYAKEKGNLSEQQHAPTSLEKVGHNKRDTERQPGPKNAAVVPALLGFISAKNVIRVGANNRQHDGCA